MNAAEYWRHEFDYQREEVLHRLEVQNELGQGALKSMMLTNGGAIIGLLTFVGNKGTVGDPDLLRWGLGCFGVGLFLGLLAYFGAYFSQAHFMDHACYKVVNAQSRMAGMEEVVVPPLHETRGMRWLYSSVLLLLGALIMFATGALVTLNAII